MPRLSSLVAAILLLLAAASGCGGTRPEANGPVDALEPVQLGEGESLRVVATTNIIADVVMSVGGDQIVLRTLMEVGVDPHSYVPTPAHAAVIHDAHLVFANGLGLESDLAEVLESAGGDAVQILLSKELGTLGAAEGPEAEADTHEDEQNDPHVWFDVRKVIKWVETIEQVLGELDPENALVYTQNAQAYIGELQVLDSWIEEQVNSLPTDSRELITNHPAFGYLAARYGLRQIGAVYPISPSAEPSAQDIAVLENAILEYGVPAVFTESTVNAKLAQQVADDTGVRLVQLYSGSLGGPGSGAETYLEFMRYNVSAIVDALN